MVDNDRNDDLSSDPVGTATPTRCATCGTPLDRGDWHPTIGHTDEEGAYHIVRFCSDECRDEWRTANRERDET